MDTCPSKWKTPVRFGVSIDDEVKVVTGTFQTIESTVNKREARDMPQRYYVLLCNNYDGHQFPKDKNKHFQWIIAINRIDPK